MTMTKQSRSWLSIARPYQFEGVKKMVSQACLGLLMKPGLGKTSVVLMAISLLKQAGFVQKTLVICPIRPMYNVWPNQPGDYKEFKGLRVKVLHGPKKEQALLSDDADIYVVNPDGLEWLFGANVVKSSKGNKTALDPARVRYIREKFQMLVVDESTKFKNSQTNRFKLLRQIVKFFKRRYIMTGSPTPKGLLDLFGQIYILDEGQSLGSYISHYRNEYFYPGGYGGYEWSPKDNAKERITNKISPLTMVVEAEGNIELPRVLSNDIFFDLPATAQALYTKMENDLMAGEVVAANAAVASSKCRQICNGGLYSSDEEGKGTYEIVHMEKIAAVQELLEQLGGAALLITYEFEFDRIQLSALNIPSISTGNAKRDSETIAKFARGELIAVMGHPQSISLGIDGLQHHCRDICMVGINWSLENYEQVIDRVRRSGNPNDSITLHRILARGTVDERVIRVLDARDKEQVDFLKALKNS